MGLHDVTKTVIFGTCHGHYSQQKKTWVMNLIHVVSIPATTPIHVGSARSHIFTGINYNHYLGIDVLFRFMLSFSILSYINFKSMINWSIVIIDWPITFGSNGRNWGFRIIWCWFGHVIWSYSQCMFWLS